MLGFEFFKFRFGSFQNNSSLDCVHEILDFFLIFTESALQSRKHWTFLGLQIKASLADFPDKRLVLENIHRRVQNDVFNQFFLNGLLIAFVLLDIHALVIPID